METNIANTVCFFFKLNKRLLSSKTSIVIYFSTLHNKSVYDVLLRRAIFSFGQEILYVAHRDKLKSY